MLHNRHSNRRVGAMPDQPGEAARAAEAKRAAQVVRMARIALRPYATLPQNSRTTTIATKANDLGGSEALGAMLRLARIEVTDDYLTPEAEGADIMDMLQNSTLNWSVVLSLLLTMYVSMAVMHTGSSAYASGAAAQRLAVGKAWPR